MATSRKSSPNQTTLFGVRELISSLGAPPVNPSRSLDSGEDSRILAETSRWPLSRWRQFFSLAGSCGKTYPEPCQQTTDGLSVPSLGRWSNSGMAAPGEAWTLNTCEWTATLVPCPNDGNVSSLSDVLVDPRDVPERYYLSRKACQGILRRAESRGKELPQVLREALLSVAQETKEPKQKHA